MLRLGSLCTGYGGLDLAAEHVLGPMTHTWHAEIDPHASTVLAHHWPTTPNLGDLTTVDWTAVEPVDVLTAGFPCQDVSCAGKRAGLVADRVIPAGEMACGRQIPDQWGPYAVAVARWEAATGRTAPSPTEPGKNGQPRLSPPFVEWLMGLPAGWVTDHVPRGGALKCLGNGVVWQQAAHAYTELLGTA